MEIFGWGVVILLFIVLTCMSVVAVFTHLRGYFFSPHSLRLRALLNQIKQTPFRLFVNVVSRVRPGEVLVTRFQGVARALAFGLSSIVLGVICVIMFPWTVDLVVENDLTAHIGTAWQVHATITGFSVVALVFVWESLGANVQTPKLIGEMTESQGLLDRIYLLIIANLFIGAGLFISSPLSSDSTVAETPVLLQRLGLFSVVFASVFLIVSAWELLKYYEDIYKVLFRKGPDEAAIDVYQNQLEKEKRPNPSPTYREVIESRLGIELSPYMSVLPKMWQDNGVRVTAEEIDADGKELKDIKLSGLGTALEIVGKDAEVSFWYRLGDRPRGSASIMRADAEISPAERTELMELLQECYNFQS